MADAVCWTCGASLAKVLQPFGRHSECPACRAPLHVCRQCRHFDPGKAKSCREPMAEPVQEKIRTNFCEWFQTGVQAAAGSGKPVAPAREALDALFGGSEGKAPDTPSRTALDDLFGD